jgi:radical SAM protein with 4Fe4S-binding SPASM domain
MRRKCDMPFKMLKIQMDGSVFMCSSGQPAHINAFQTDPLEIWNSESFKKLRYQLDTEEYDPMCLQCPLVQDLHGAEPENNAAHVEALNYRLKANTVRTSGRRPLAPSGDLSGWVDLLQQSPTSLTVLGWAADFKNNRPAKTVVVFLDNWARGTASPSGPRVDVAESQNNPGIVSCGYYMTIPLPKGGLKPGSRVRVFALDGDGNAGELQYAIRHPLLQAHEVSRARPTLRDIASRLPVGLKKRLQSLFAV